MLIGWIVGRLHRPYGLPLVFAFSGYSLVCGVPVISSLIVNTLDHQRYVPYLVNAIEMTILTAICIVLGGFLSIGKQFGETRTETAEP
jgi:hypothetical protein